MTAASVFPLEGGMNFEAFRVRPLDDDEMALIVGGAIWAAVGVLLGAGALACVIGVAVGVALYVVLN
jgi:hypothetical protein